MKKRNKWFAMLIIVCMLVMMFGAVAQATNAGPITAQYKVTQLL